MKKNIEFSYSKYLKGLKKKWSKRKLNKFIKSLNNKETFITVYVNKNNVPIYLSCWGKQIYITDQINKN